MDCFDASLLATRSEMTAPKESVAFPDSSPTPVSSLLQDVNINAKIAIHAIFSLNFFIVIII